VSAIADAIRTRWPSLPVDSRVELLPDKPDAVEVHVRAAGGCDLVVGYNGRRFGELSAGISRIVGEHGALWDRWVAASGDAPLDAGAQLGHERVQTYLRGHYTAADIERAALSAGVPLHKTLVANALALFATDNAEMIGLELGAHVGMAIYFAVRNTEEERAALAGAIRFLVGATCSPAEADRWVAVSNAMLRTVTEEFVYVSFPPDPSIPWVKIDAGARPVALAATIARELGIDAKGLVAAAAANRVQVAAHVGLRLGGAAPELSIYCPIL
jgi:hypothetical protein